MSIARAMGAVCDSRRKQDLAPAAVQECHAGLWRSISISLPFLHHLQGDATLTAKKATLVTTLLFSGLVTSLTMERA